MKDQNYVAKIEKAISEKYGEQAIVNPRSGWDKEKEEKYLQELKKVNDKHYAQEVLQEKVEHEGVLLSKKLLMKSGNTSCPHCRKYNLTSRDEIYILRWECCEVCHIKYVEGREERWKQGWRPKDNG